MTSCLNDTEFVVLDSAKICNQTRMIMLIGLIKFLVLSYFYRCE